MLEQKNPKIHRISRRQFLALAASLGGAALLDACLSSPAQSPTPTKNLPIDPTKTPSPTPFLFDTATPPMATEIPTPTATPLATPFPPGPATKLGFVVTRNDPTVFTLAATRNVALIKTLEHDPTFLRDIKNLSPDTLIIGRPTFLEQVNLDNFDPIAAARQFLEQLLPIAMDERRRGLYAGWESYNEPTPSNAEQMRRYAAFEAERTRLLAEHGIVSVVGNFGTGQPPLELWPDFYPALEAAKAHNGFLGLHEYSAPDLWYGTSRPNVLAAFVEDEGWLTLRYRKVYRNLLQPAGLAIPLLITECGIDGLVTDRPGPSGGGWRDFVEHWDSALKMGKDGAGNYIEQLAWYDSALQQDDFVKGAAIYALVASGGWESYELLGDAAKILEQYLSVHPER